MSNMVMKEGETSPPPIEEQHEEPVEEKKWPTMIVLNPRYKILPEYVDLEKVAKRVKEKPVRNIAAHRWLSSAAQREPVPKFPLCISWWPKVLCFKLQDEVVVVKLHISNRSSHMIYFMYCGLWEQEARLGASWQCGPRTRFLVAPGMIGVLQIRAEPREFTPISVARAGLQIATAFPRDTVVGYFVVPIHAQFLNFIDNVEEEIGEGE